MDSVIQFEGTIYENGYGLLAQKVMRDKSLPKQSKLIYAYMCSFAGVGKNGERTAFPSISLQCSELGMTEDTYFKWRKPLLDKGYIKITKKRQEGAKFDNNVYSIMAVPLPVETKENADLPESEPYPKKSGTDGQPYPNFSSTEKPGTEKQGTNNNSSIINSFIINKKEEEEEKLQMLCKLFSELITPCNKVINSKLSKWLEKLPYEVIEAQIEECALLGAKTWKYVNTALEEDLELDIKTVAELEAKIENHNNNKNTKKSTKTRKGKVVKKGPEPEWLEEKENNIEMAAVLDIEEKRKLEEKRRAVQEKLKKYAN